MDNITRFYPFQPQYNSLFDSNSQPDKDSAKPTLRTNSNNVRVLQSVFDSIDDLIERMSRKRQKLSEHPALCERLLEEIYTYRIELNKALLNNNLAFFDISGELVREENDEVTCRVIQLLDLEYELQQVEIQCWH